jgi:hypothetical protein
MLNPQALEQAFRDWVSALVTLSNGEVLAIDGKTLRRSFQKAGSSAFVHGIRFIEACSCEVAGRARS